MRKLVRRINKQRSSQRKYKWRKEEDVHTKQLGKRWLEGVVEVVNGRKTDCTKSVKRRSVLQVERRR